MKKKGISKVALFGATFCLLMNTLVKAQIGYINTICGTGIAGYNGDNIPANSAEINSPEGMCIDDSGNILIGDSGNCRIRKISKTAGMITTLVGDSICGYSCDNCIAFSSEIWYPEAVKADDSNNIYIADAQNNRIRKINAATGIITTIAGTGIAGAIGDGGPAIYAELNSPSGLCLDKHSNIYIADYGNNKVRKLNTLTGIISTFAGNSLYGYSGDNGLALNAEFSLPIELCLDTLGNILIADLGNNVIRKININTDTIITIAGNGTAGHTGDSGLAINATLNQPGGLFVDKYNNIFIAEYGSGVIRKIDAATGIIYTIAGTGVSRYYGDGGPAINAQLIPADVCLDNNGNIYIADYGNNRIRKITETTGIPTSPSGSEVVVYPLPAQNLVYIKGLNTTATYKLCNMIGTTILQGTLTNNSIDTSKLASGVYILTLTPQHTPDPSQEGNVVMRRIIKQ